MLYIYIYICMCVCVRHVSLRMGTLFLVSLLYNQDQKAQFPKCHCPMATLEEGSYKSTMSDLGQYQGFSVPERPVHMWNWCDCRQQKLIVRCQILYILQYGIFCCSERNVGKSNSPFLWSRFDADAVIRRSAGVGHTGQVPFPPWRHVFRQARLAGFMVGQWASTANEMWNFDESWCLKREGSWSLTATCTLSANHEDSKRCQIRSNPFKSPEAICASYFSIPSLPLGSIPSHQFPSNPFTMKFPINVPIKFPICSNVHKVSIINVHECPSYSIKIHQISRMFHTCPSFFHISWGFHQAKKSQEGDHCLGIKARNSNVAWKVPGEMQGKVGKIMEN